MDRPQFDLLLLDRLILESLSLLRRQQGSACVNNRCVWAELRELLAILIVCHLFIGNHLIIKAALLATLWIDLLDVSDLWTSLRYSKWVSAFTRLLQSQLLISLPLRGGLVTHKLRPHQIKALRHRILNIWMIVTIGARSSCDDESESVRVLRNLFTYCWLSPFIMSWVVESFKMAFNVSCWSPSLMKPSSRFT